MRVVITGASGNVGTALVRRLAAEDAVDSVVGIARRRHEWQPDEGSQKLSWRYLDVATGDRDELVEAFRGADAVVHLAWLFQPTHRPQTTWQANVVGSEHVLQSVADAGVPAVVVASSVGAYAPRRDLRPVDESYPTSGCPTAAYSREKAYVERLLDVHEARHPDRRVVRMRPGFIFQRSASAEQRRLFLGPLVPARVLSRGRLPVLPLPRGLMLPVLHSDDAADAFAAAVLRPVGGAFNIAAGAPLDGADLARVMGARLVEVPVGVVRRTLAVGWAAHAVPASPGLFDLAMSIPMLDDARARRELGWDPRHDGAAALTSFLEGIEQRADDATPPLSAATGGPLRSHELGTGVGTRP